MSRIHSPSFAVAALLLSIVACHKSKPMATPSAPSPVTDNGDANARRDSIARADAARQDSIARADAARRDSIAARSAAAAAARATITAVIYFAYDKADLTADARAALDAKVAHLRAWPDIRIRIEGNTDERGSDEYNLALGQRRSAAAKRYLVDRGIADGRIDAVSVGEERPVCGDAAESCWQQNRRDEFLIVAGTLTESDTPTRP